MDNEAGAKESNSKKIDVNPRTNGTNSTNLTKNPRTEEKKWKKPLKKALLLVNQNAGTGNAKGKVFRLISGLVKLGYEVITYPIIPKMNITSENIIEAYKSRVKLVACVGGDGTLNHVVNALMAATDKEKASLPVLYIPSGTTNDYAKTLGLSGDVEKVIHGVEHSRVYRLDIGTFSDKYFNYVAAFGAFTNVSYATPQDQKNLLGYLAYLVNGLASAPVSLQTRYHLEVSHDGITEEGDYVFGAVSNATSVGGFKTPALANASLSDGLFEVILIKAPDALQEIGEILMAAGDGSFDNPHIKIFRTSEVTFRSDNDIDWTIDGEYGGAKKEVTVSVIPQAIRIYAED